MRLFRKRDLLVTFLGLIYQLLQRYVEEDKCLAAKKVRQTSYSAKRVIKDAVMPEYVPELAKSLSSDIEVLEQYSTKLDRILGPHKRGGRSKALR